MAQPSPPNRATFSVGAGNPSTSSRRRCARHFVKPFGEGVREFPGDDDGFGIVSVDRRGEPAGDRQRPSGAVSASTERIEAGVKLPDLFALVAKRHRHVAEFAGEPMRAPQNTPVADHAAAYAAGEHDREQIAAARLVGEMPLAEGRRVGVVLRHDRRLEMRTQTRNHVDVAPAEQRRRQHHAAARHKARHRHADAAVDAAQAHAATQLADKPRDRAEHLRRRRADEFAALLRSSERNAAEIDRDGDQPLDADLHPEEMRGVRPQPQQLTRPSQSHARFFGGFDEQPRRDQAVGEIGHRRARQTEPARESGARGRAVGEQALQNPPRISLRAFAPVCHVAFPRPR